MSLLATGEEIRFMRRQFS